MIRHAELRHLIDGPRADEQPMGAGLVEVKFVSNDADVVLARTKEVLLEVFKFTTPWPNLEEWLGILPQWFIEACADERSEAEEDAWLLRWRTLGTTEKRQAERERTWSLADWLYWFEPDERTWFWWDSRVRGVKTGSIWLEVPGWPFPVGALAWLLRASGANHVETDDL